VRQCYTKTPGGLCQQKIASMTESSKAIVNAVSTLQKLMGMESYTSQVFKILWFLMHSLWLILPRLIHLPLIILQLHLIINGFISSQNEDGIQLVQQSLENVLTSPKYSGLGDAFSFSMSNLDMCLLPMFYYDFNFLFYIYTLS
jgi:hypothetical protein